MKIIPFIQNSFKTTASAGRHAKNLQLHPSGRHLIAKGLSAHQKRVPQAVPGPENQCARLCSNRE
jgi:hypothetical protein